MSHSRSERPRLSEETRELREYDLVWTEPTGHWGIVVDMGEPQKPVHLAVSLVSLLAQPTPQQEPPPTCVVYLPVPNSIVRFTGGQRERIWHVAWPYDPSLYPELETRVRAMGEIAKVHHAHCPVGRDIGIDAHPCPETHKIVAGLAWLGFPIDRRSAIRDVNVVHEVCTAIQRDRLDELRLEPTRTRSVLRGFAASRHPILHMLGLAALKDLSAAIEDRTAAERQRLLDQVREGLARSDTAQAKRKLRSLCRARIGTVISTLGAIAKTVREHGDRFVAEGFETFGAEALKEIG